VCADGEIRQDYLNPSSTCILNFIRICICRQFGPSFGGSWAGRRIMSSLLVSVIIDGLVAFLFGCVGSMLGGFAPIEQC